MEVIYIIVRPLAYTSDVHIVAGRKGPVTIENLSPILSDEEKVEQRRCIEEGLFNIFIKYTYQHKNNSQLRAPAV